MTSIELRTLRDLERRDVRRLVAGYVSSEAYRVRKTGSKGLVVLRLERVSLRQPYQKRFLFPEADWSRYRAVVRQGFSVGAFDGKRLVGLALAERREWNRSLWVWELGVAATHRRRGIGTLLVQELSRRARAAGLRILVCETQTTNVPAIDFYRKNGFSVHGIDLSYYSNHDVARGEVALFMKKALARRTRPRGPVRREGPHTTE